MVTLNKGRFQKGHTPWCAGKKMTEEQRAKLRVPHQGKNLSKEYRELQSSIAKEKGYGKWNCGRVLSVEERKRLSDKLKAYYDRTGRKNSPARLFRETSAYRTWRKNVFTRDNYTCQECNVTGVYVHADHIKPFSLYPELRLELSNGRTLCVPCHIKTDTWGRKGKGHKQLLAKANQGNSW